MKKNLHLTCGKYLYEKPFTSIPLEGILLKEKLNGTET